MRKVMFVCYGGGHVAMVIPVVNELQRRGGWQPTVFGLTTAKAKLQEANIPSLGFCDLLDPHDTRAVEHGRRLASENYTAGAGVSEAESVAYLGLSYADLEDRLGVEGAAREYEARKRHAFLPVGPLRRALARVEPDLVVVTSSPKSERAAVIAAAEAGVPSIAMIDLFGREWDFLYDPHYADQMCVMSSMVKNDFLSRGRRAEDTVVTGNPAFDRLADPKFAAIGHAWRHEHEWGDSLKKVVLWADTIMLSNEHRQQVWDVFQKCVQLHPNWHFIYRPHPSMGTMKFDLPANCSLGDNRVELAAQIHASDCVLVTISTCGIEAALLDKPVVKLRFVDPAADIFTPEYARMDFLAPYEEMGIVVPVTRLGDLPGGIASAMPGGSQFAALQTARRLLPPVGQAARNVVDAMEGILHSRARQQSQQKRVA